MLLFVLLAVTQAHISFSKTPANGRNGDCSSANGFPVSPQTLQPFQSPFRIPRVAVPKLSKCETTGECIDYYEINVRAVNLTIFPGKQTTWFAYDGEIPGPTFRGTKGRQFIVRFINKISQTLADRTGDGKPDIPSGIHLDDLRHDPAAWPISVHLHGSPSIAAYDGWADDITRSGQFKDYYYPGNHPSLEWYHDHAIGVTSVNAILGLAGFAIIHDPCNPYQQKLPHEKFDMEFMLADRVFDENNQILYDHSGPHNDDYYGDHIFVNGVAWPTMRVEPRKYRFRMLNVGPTRPYALYLSNGANFTLVGTEGGPLTEPRNVQTILFGVSERFDVIIDFSKSWGQTIYLKNGDISSVPQFCQTHLVMKFEVTLPLDINIPDYPVPQRLRDSRPLSETISDAAITKALNDFRAGASPTRRFHFERKNGLWTVNGVTWEDEFRRVLATGLLQNSIEIWDFTTGGGWFHPVHLHLVDFLFVNREKYGLMPWEIESSKDVVYLGPGERVRVIIRFGATPGDYMFHCHNLVHEDFDMMIAMGVGRAKPIGVSIEDLPSASSSSSVDPNTQDWLVKPPRIDATNVFKGTPQVPANSQIRNPMFDQAKNLNTMLMPTVDADEAYLSQVIRLRLYNAFYPVNQSTLPPVHKRKCSVADVKSDSDLLCNPYEVDYTSCITNTFTTANPYTFIHPTVAAPYCPPADGNKCAAQITTPLPPSQYRLKLGLSAVGGLIAISAVAGLLYRRRKRTKVSAEVTNSAQSEIQIQDFTPQGSIGGT